MEDRAILSKQILVMQKSSGVKVFLAATLMKTYRETVMCSILQCRTALCNLVIMVLN